MTEKRRRKSVYGRTKAEVLGKLREARKQAAAGLLLASEQTTVEEFLTSWLEAIRPTVRASTYRHYKLHVTRHAVPAIGRGRLVKLTPQHLERLYADRICVRPVAADGRASTSGAASRAGASDEVGAGDA